MRRSRARARVLPPIALVVLILLAVMGAETATFLWYATRPGPTPAESAIAREDARRTVGERADLFHRLHRLQKLAR